MLIGAIRNGQMRYVVPTKFSNTQTSGAFQLWARDIKEFVYWHDTMIKSMTEDYGNTWIVDTRLANRDMAEICNRNGADVESDQALRMVIGALLEGEAKVLSETATVMNDHGSGTVKSGIINCNWPCINIQHHPCPRSDEPSPCKGDARCAPRAASLDRAHQEYQQQALALKDRESPTMRQHEIQG